MSAAVHPRSAGPFAFSAENEARARSIVARYPAGRQASAVVPLLDLAQRQNGGSLTQEAIEHVAAMLSMPPMRVLEVASFYSMLHLTPVGRYHVQVCRTTPCWLRGGHKLTEICQRATGAPVDGVSGDGVFSLVEVECLGACVNAPVVQINDDYYEDLDEASLMRVLEALRRGETPKPGSQSGRQNSAPEGGPTTLRGEG